ncbi:hypothetical protein [Metabacillus halosaccharovorans]|uniref:hypothetical protein n=1 Tax=Metabacillus halosaccharovorans TaxID=930124 RepID=UPI001C1F405B|nr:hypothetical protein [Metabacillus halosaccharovorans]
MKWRNYGLWMSVASVLYMVFRDLGLQIDLTSWETYVTSILGILVTLGIISNPESGRGFFSAKTPPQLPDQSVNSQQSLQQNNVTNEMNAEIESDEMTPDRQYIPYEK